MRASVTLWEATAPVKLPTRHCLTTGSRSRLEPKHSKGGISPATPPILTNQVQSLPPILHRLSPNPMPSCSKAPRGLLVLLRERSIFTPNSVSPGPPLRQCPIRYAFRAGRNLPDKEFRYLRTVIVTAAVHRGFSSGLAPLPLTFRHWAGVSLYTSSCDLAQTCVFDKQSTGPFLCGLLKLTSARLDHLTEAFLLPKLRNHFAEFLNEGYPDPLSILYLSTCVGLRYGRAGLTRGFSWQYRFGRFTLYGLAVTPQLSESFNPRLKAYRLGAAVPAAVRLTLLRPPIAQTSLRGTGILTCCPSTTPFGLALGPTNPTRIDLPSETLDIRGLRFSRNLCYSCQHSHFCPLHVSLR